MNGMLTAMQLRLTRHQWYVLIGGWLVAGGFGALLLGALSTHGALDRTDPSIRLMEVLLAEFGAIVLVAAALQSLGEPKQFDVLPVSNREIAASFLGITALYTGAGYVAMTAILKGMFGFGQLGLGPAVAIAVGAALIQASLWFFQKSYWLPLGATTIAVAEALWWRLRFGPLPEFPQRDWTSFTPAEAATLIAAAVTAWMLGTYSIARNRRGEQLSDRWLLAPYDAWLRYRSTQPVPSLSSGIAAQYWSLSYGLFWSMPVGALFSLWGIALLICLSFACGQDQFVWQRAVNELAVAPVFGPLLLGGLGTAVGFTAGHRYWLTAQSDAALTIGSFYGTRPLSNRQFAEIYLRFFTATNASSLLTFACAGLGVLGLLQATGLISPWLTTMGGQIAIQLAYAALAGWIGLTTMGAVALSGRTQQYAIGFVGMMFGFAITLAILRMFVSGATVDAIANGLFLLIAAGFAVLLVASMITAIRRRLISRRWQAAMAIGALLIPAAFVWSTRQFATQMPLPVAWLLGTSAALLAIAPPATIPLAFAMNRTR